MEIITKRGIDMYNEHYDEQYAEEILDENGEILCLDILFEILGVV